MGEQREMSPPDTPSTVWLCCRQLEHEYCTKTVIRKLISIYTATNTTVVYNHPIMFPDLAPGRLLVLQLTAFSWFHDSKPEGIWYLNIPHSPGSPQQPPLGQRKVAIVERWPLWGGTGVMRPFTIKNRVLCTPLSVSDWLAIVEKLFSIGSWDEL